MSVLLRPRTPPTAPADPQPVDPELLIKEARERQRRRRWRLAAVALGLAAVGSAVYTLVGRDGAHGIGIERIPNGPIVNIGAFANRGELAFVSGSKLWLLANGAVRPLPTTIGYTPTQPTFSADGKWLAYLQVDATSPYDEELWLARADGTGAHVVPRLTVYKLFGWSPTTDQLAVAAGPERTEQPCPCYTPTTLRLVSPDRGVRTLARATWLYGAAWSPDGTRIAGAAIAARTSTLISYPASGGPGTIWLRRDAKQRLNGMNGALVDLAGWWPRLGIGIWIFGNGMTHHNDQTPLDLISAPRTAPRLLGRTLSDGITDAVAASSTGAVAVVTDHGGGRFAWQDKTVVLCTPTTPCQPLPHARADGTLDPAWSPDGARLAYIEAPNVLTGPWSQRQVAGWFAAHRVLLYDTTSRTARELPAAHGATAINWSRDGRSLLYVRNNAIWLLPTLTGQPVRIASPLFTTPDWPQYYAQIGWSTQFAWSAG